MACYNCLGLGHPERLCASPFKAGEQKLGPKCKTCGGFGHDTPTCASKGGGKYSPPPGKGKGKDSQRAKERDKDLSGAKAPGAKAKVRCQHSMIGQLHQEGLGTSGANHQDLNLGCRQRRLRQRGRQCKEHHLHGRELKHRLHGLERPHR